MMTVFSRMTPAMSLFWCAVLATACGDQDQAAPADSWEASASSLTGALAFGEGPPADSGDDDDGQPGSEIIPRPGFYTQAMGEAAGIATSRHNLYWTSNTALPGASASTVFVMGKHSLTAAARHREAGAGISFGDIAFKHSDDYYIYFVVNDQAGAPISRIKRVPLYPSRPVAVAVARRLVTVPVEIATGGPVVIAASPAFIGPRDLAVDAQRLYWASEAGIHSVALAGGPVTTLVATAGASKLGLDASYVYYSEGASIRRVRKLGGVAGGFAVAESAVTALAVDGGWVVWGEEGGAVRARATAARIAGKTLRGPLAGRSVSSIMRADGRTLWSDCNRDLDTACTVNMHLPSGKTEVLLSGDYQRLRHITASGVGAFWSDAVAIRHHVYSH